VSVLKNQFLKKKKEKKKSLLVPYLICSHLPYNIREYICFRCLKQIRKILFIISSIFLEKKKEKKKKSLLVPYLIWCHTCGLDRLNMVQPRQPIGPNGKLLYA